MAKPSPLPSGAISLNAPIMDNLVAGNGVSLGIYVEDDINVFVITLPGVVTTPPDETPIFVDFPVP